MSENIDISVVMGVYNNAETLCASLDSVLSQEGVELEFVVIDDGSTDETGEILDRYAVEDPRLKVVHKKNEGLTRALIDGCAMARGRYVARIDNGDVMVAGRLRHQQAVFDQCPDVVFVSCWAEFCGPQWESLYIYKGNGCSECGECVLPRELDGDLTDVPCHHGSAMFRRDVYEAAGGYRWQFYYTQDWDLWYRLAERGKLAIVSDVLYRARVFPSGISSLNMDYQQQMIQHARAAFHCRRRGEPDDVALEAAASIRPVNTGRKAQRDRGNGAHFIGELLRKKGDVRCRRYFIQALRAFPFRLNTWVRLSLSFMRINKRSGA